MYELSCSNIVFGHNSWTCDYSVSFEPQRFHMVCGTSGSGKSTLLKLIAGLAMPKSGHIKIGERTISSLPPHLRGVSFMGQQDGLFPGMSIFENLKLSFHDSKLKESLQREKILNITTSLGLEESFLNRLPSKVSGGQLSRCNLARAILRPCEWLLLDEPFAAVDRPTRLSILKWLREWQLQNTISIILVSHDLDDVFATGTHLTAIANGRIIEQAPLDVAINQPKSSDTARFLRSGLVLTKGQRNFFVSAGKIFTAKTDLNCPTEHLQCHRLESPHVTKIGNVSRIIDLSDGTDVTLSHTSEFEGNFWFDARDAIEIS